MADLKRLTPTELARAAGISVPYASQLLREPGQPGGKTPSMATALRIYRATGLRLGPIATASEAEIDVLDRFRGAA